MFAGRLQNTHHYHSTKIDNLFIFFNVLADYKRWYQLLVMEREGGIQDAAKPEEFRLPAVVTGLIKRIK